MPILVLKESAFNGTELRSEYVVVADASTGDITTVGRTREAGEAKGTQVITVKDLPPLGILAAKLALL